MGNIAGQRVDGSTIAGGPARPGGPRRWAPVVAGALLATMALAGAQAQAGGTQPAHQLAAGCRYRAQLQHLLVVLVRYVVVGAVEAAARYARRFGKGVQLVQRVVTDQVRPQPVAVQPARLVDP